MPQPDTTLGNPAPLTEPLDLSNCDREPIHIPDYIQPHGLLLLLREPELQIIQTSDNSQALIGQSPDQLLNQSLAQLLDSPSLTAIRACLAEDFEHVNPLKIAVTADENVRLFEGIIHRHAGNLILELEPCQGNTRSNSSTDFFSFYHLVRGTINKLQNATTLTDMCVVIVNEVQKLTGFERVLVYRFNQDSSGQVIAEAKTEALTPFLGLHYPASDIPQQARKLYTLNWLRLIPDVGYQPATLVPTLNPLTQQPTDLSLSVLRSVSPLHVEYLHNMGVGASMSISLIRNKQLWGLIACHDSQPRYLSYEVRTACEFLGQVMSLELIAKEDTEDLDYRMRLKSLLSRFMETIPQSTDLPTALAEAAADLLALTSATGAAICWDDEWTQLGQTPDVQSLQELLAWVETQMDGNLYCTDALPGQWSAAADYGPVASGVIALAVSKVNRHYLFWFRPEVVQTVNWGGNPNKPVGVQSDGGLQLSPRKSFALWQQTVQGKSLPWKACELEAVQELRSAIVTLVLRRADELARMNQELERSNNELDAFAYIASHDLKEPLRGIHNYSNFLIEDFGQVLNEEGIAKLQTLVRLTQRMEDLINSLLHFSRLGRVELNWQPTDLNELLASVLDVLRLSQPLEQVEFQIPRPLPTVTCDRIQMNEVFSNLISNAIKYNDREEKWVEIGYLDPAPESHQDKSLPRDELLSPVTVFYVRDNGIGVPEHHLENIFRIFKRLHGPKKYGGGTGAGLTIAKKIVERHGGRIWVESVCGQGSTFYFTLPDFTLPDLTLPH